MCDCSRSGLPRFLCSGFCCWGGFWPVLFTQESEFPRFQNDVRGNRSGGPAPKLALNILDHHCDRYLRGFNRSYANEPTISPIEGAVTLLLDHLTVSSSL